MSSVLATAPLPTSNSMGVGKGSGAGGSTTVENFTISCFTCGMPTAKEWAHRAHSKPQTPLNKPYYPFLEDVKTPPPGAYLCLQDGTTFLCAFCTASLEAQWRAFEKASVLMKDRQYNLNNFVCAVCGIETYRKRVRALPFQEFPFLTKERPRGSLTLGKHPLAVVCLDCSETLWAQSAEYDRWGLPVHKRHFNWMTRPPPPENSMEATVARLPSGETQLPRCPPTEPMVVPRRKEPFNVATVPKPVTEFRVRTSSMNSKGTLQNPNIQYHRSFGKRLSPDGMGGNESPANVRYPAACHTDVTLLAGPGIPVVTVAPLPPHVTSTPKTSAHHGDSHPLTSNKTNMDLLRHAQTSELGHPGLSYGSFSYWGGTGGVERFPYAPSLPVDLPKGGSTHQSNNNGQLSWNVPQPIINPDYARYQSYLAVAGDSYKNAVASYFSQARPHPLLQTHAAEPNGSNNWNRNSSSVHSQQVVAQLLGKKPIPPPGAPFSESSRKRHGPPEGSVSPPLPKLSCRGNFRSDSSDRVSRALPVPPGKGVEPNREYICSVSSILKESEMARPGAIQNMSTIPSPQIRRQYVQEANGAMDLSLMRALKTYPTTPGLEIVERAIPSRYSVGVSTGPPPDKIGSGFLIANLCGEDLSPETTKNRSTPFIGSPVLKPSLSQRDDESRNSVIVQCKSPITIVGRVRSPEVAKSPTLVILSPEESEQTNDAESANSVGNGMENVVETQYEVVELAKAGLEKSTEIATCNSSNEIKSDDDLVIVCDENTELIIGKSDEVAFESTNIEKNGPDNELSEEQIVEKSILEYKAAKAEAVARQKKEIWMKEEFLDHLELIPPAKKNEMELRVMLSRFARGTLPVIKMRPPDLRDEKEIVMSDDIEKHVLLTAFEDASLKKPSNNSTLLNFMKNLKMKPASKAEKYRREENWRLQLAERILRLKRGGQLSGGKKPWDTMETISKHLLCTPPRKRRHSLPLVSSARKPRQMRSLSLTLPPSLPCGMELSSSDLLATVPKEVKTDMLLPEIDTGANSTTSIINRLGTSNKNLQKILSLTSRFRQPVISYPKYIPSYATTVPVSSVIPVQNGELHLSTTVENGQSTNVKPCPDSPLQDEDEEENKYMADDIDAVIERNKESWKATTDLINHFVRARSTPLERHPHHAELEKIRKSIQSQVSDMKQMMQWLKLGYYQ